MVDGTKKKASARKEGQSLLHSATRNSNIGIKFQNILLFRYVLEKHTLGAYLTDKRQ